MYMLMHSERAPTEGWSFVFAQVFAEKMGLETGWNCHISLTPNGDSPCEGAPSSPSHCSLHEDLNQGTGVGNTLCIVSGWDLMG